MKVHFFGWLVRVAVRGRAAWLQATITRRQ
jgi:hypothetical protein